MGANQGYLQVLHREFDLRRKNNQRYSLRAFARQLQMDPSTLAKVLKGQRPFPIADADRVSASLKLTLDERKAFVQSVLLQRGLQTFRPTAKFPKTYLRDALHYKVIAEWEHFAVLNLFHLKDFESSERWMADRLGLPERRITVVLQQLLSCGLIERKGDGSSVIYQRTGAALDTSEDVCSLALQQAHREEMLVAQQKMAQLPVEVRDLCSVVFAGDPKFLKKAKKLTREYRDRLAHLMEDGQKLEVYQLSIQLVPLTIPRGERS